MYRFTKSNQTISIVVVLITTLLLTFSCSKSPTGDDPPTVGTVALTVTPAHAAPGVTLTVFGATVDTSALASYRLIIGGQQTLLLTDTLGSVSGVAPAFFKDSTSTWPTPPGNALDIELYKDTILVGRGVGIFTGDSLVHVPGSTQKMVTNTIATVESYKSILAALSSGPSVQEQLAVGMITALDSLLYGRGDSSMTSLLTELQANNPEALALIDAIYGSSGSAEQSQEIADAMAAIAQTLNSLNPGNRRRTAELTNDVRLAVTMQLASILKLFGDSFIHGAASSASNIAFASGWIQIANVIPGFNIINAFAATMAVTTSLVDLIFNKIIVASMPTVIDSLTITLSSDTLPLGDTTVSSLKLYARNSPPQISLPDLLSQFAGIIGLQGSTVASSLESLLLGTLNTLLGLLNNALQAYHTAHPGFSYDPTFFDLGGIPIIYWETVVRDPRLLDLHAISPKLAVEDSLLEWRSTGNTGFANVTITPAVGEDAVLIPIPPFLAYGGTAFGLLADSSAFVSETKEITITSNLALILDFATTISREGANVLGVRAGEIGIAGDTIWRSGLNISLNVFGGGASPISGVTDNAGRFSSLITLFPTFDTVKVVVRVTGPNVGFATDEVKATLQTNIGGTFTAIIPGAMLSISADGTVDTIISNVNIGGGQIFEWSPDGTKFAGRNSSNVIGIDGSTVLIDGQTGTFNVNWSSDGNYIYSSRSSEYSILDSSIIKVIPTDGSASYKLYGVTYNFVQPVSFQDSKVSHDGNSIAIVEPFLDTAVASAVSNLKTINTNTGVATTRVSLVKDTCSCTINQLSSIRWSKDDTKIVYSIFYRGGGTSNNTEFFLLDINTQVITKIPLNLHPLNTFCQVVEFLPNGNEILFRRNSLVSGVKDAFIVDINTGSIQAQLPAGINYSSSADGTKFAFVERINNKYYIKIVDRNSNILGQTTEILSPIGAIRWRP